MTFVKEKEKIPEHLVKYFEPLNKKCGECYICKLCDIFDEVWRVLKPEGSLWVNIGDTYSKYPKRNKTSISDKSLCLIPQRFAIEMSNRGWIVRNTIVWHKPSCMPQSVKDRFTVSHEYLYFFVKQQKYYFEQQLDKALTRDNITRDRDTTKLNNTPGRSKMSGLKENNYEFRNKRTVWTINTKPFKEAHFAVYPEALCETPIRAGCPEGGIVLDPFFGSGTTGVMALKLNRKFIGIELNPEYIKIAENRLAPLLEQGKLF